MSQAKHQVGDTYLIQFVWQLPDGDYLRALYEAEVLAVIDEAEKYMIRLKTLVAGSQEDPQGHGRDKEAFTKPYWAKVVQYIGNKITVAWETADGRPLQMRLTTLTGEHDFFTRFNRDPQQSTS